MHKSLEHAIRLAGGQSAVAEACGVKQQHVWYWLRKSRKWPAEHVITLCEMTRGAYAPQDLRPDVFGKKP